MAKSSKNSKQSHNSGNKFNNGSSNKAAWNSRSSQNNSRVRNNSLSDSMWNDSEEHFPALGASAAPVPKVNVWQERISKREAVKALEPQNEYDEEAMLQQALALSIREAEEQERQRKLEEKYYMSQAEEFPPESNTEDFDYFDDVQDDFISSKSSELETPVSIKPAEDFSTENISNNSIVSNSNQNVKTYNCNGAKPKLNRIIEKFGGWGLKDEKSVNNSEKLSNFVDKVVSERPLKKADKNDVLTLSNHQSDYGDVIKNVNDEKLCNVLDTNVGKGPTVISDPWESDEILYDEKGTFTDKEDIKLDNSSNAQNVSTSKLPDVLDTWLISDDNDNWENNAVLNSKGRISTNVHVQNDDQANFMDSDSLNNDLQKCEETTGKFASVSDTVDYRSENASSKLDDILDSSTKDYVCSKSSWPDHKQKNEVLQNNFGTVSYDVNELSVTEKFTRSAESAQIPCLPNKDIWAEKTSNTCITSLPDKQIQPKTELDFEVKPISFCGDVENEVFNNVSNIKDNVSPILPPQSVPTVSLSNGENEIFSNTALTTNLNEESPIPPPQPAPEIQPAFPAINFPVNPTMFPGFNPFLSCGMDPIAVRQMLMLSNPFFASQLFAMEQYYMSMGMPVDLLSLSTSMPGASVPGMLGPIMQQNAFANTMNGFTPAGPLNSQLQNQFDNGSFANNMPLPQSNSDQKTLENCIQPLNSSTSTNTTSALHSEDANSWYKTLLSSDSSAVIPSPKPPSCNGNIFSVAEPSKLNQSASSLNQSNISDNSYTHKNSSSAVSSNDKDYKSLSAVEACMTKTEISGWGDDEGDSFKAPKPKTTCGWDDDGWGNDSLPAKSFKNPSVPEDKKKTVFRQPSKQPQYSRNQRNNTYR